MKKIKDLGLIGCLNDSEITSDSKIGVLPKWIRVEEGLLPPEFVDVLVFVPETRKLYFSYWHGNDEVIHWINIANDQVLPGVTHWQPLPGAPNE